MAIMVMTSATPRGGVGTNTPGDDNEEEYLLSTRTLLVNHVFLNISWHGWRQIRHLEPSATLSSQSMSNCFPCHCILDEPTITPSVGEKSRQGSLPYLEMKGWDSPVLTIGTTQQKRLYSIPSKCPKQSNNDGMQKSDLLTHLMCSTDRPMTCPSPRRQALA
jgi:hypothetical protein